MNGRVGAAAERHPLSAGRHSEKGSSSGGRLSPKVAVSFAETDHRHTHCGGWI